MDCDACNNLLLDYLYEELDEAGASAMRQHLQGCSACTEALDRLALGRRAARSLPILDAPAPSAALLAAIHAEAPAPKLRLVTGGSGSVAAEAPEPPRGKVPRWLQRVGEVAMRRQVAMAAVFLLMIGFGLSYHQLQAPTRPLPTSDDPGPTVIPARPVPTPAAPVGAAQRPTDERRPSARAANVERALEHRAPTPAPTATRGGSLGEAQSAASPAPAASPTWARTTETAPEDDSVHHGAPTTYRSQPPPPAQVPGSIATTERVSGNRDLDRGMPPLQVDSPAPVAQQPNVAAQAYGTQQWAAPQQQNVQQGVLGAEQGNRLGQRAQNQDALAVTADGWRDLQQQGNAASERGQRDAAIEAWRRALAANPPVAERRAIALRLVTALNGEGRAAEASEVQAQHLSRTNAVVDAEGQVPSPSAVGTQVAHPSRPAPSRSMPARRSRQMPASSDAYSNMAH